MADGLNEHWGRHETRTRNSNTGLNVVGIFPNEAAFTRLVGALMLEQNNEWAITRRYMTLETVATICDTLPMDPATIAALELRSSQSGRAKLHHSVGHYQNCEASWTDDKASSGIMGGGGHCRSWRNGSRRLRVERGGTKCRIFGRGRVGVDRS
jgi:hypothetical protein